VISSSLWTHYTYPIIQISEVIP